MSTRQKHSKTSPSKTPASWAKFDEAVHVGIGAADKAGDRWSQAVMTAASASAARGNSKSIINRMAGLWPSINRLPIDEYRWAIAFRENLRVDDRYYVLADAEVKRERERCAEYLAQFDTHQGRRMANVVTERIRMVLADEGHRPLLDIKSIMNDSMFRTLGPSNNMMWSDRDHDDKMDAYRYLYGQNIDRIIIDEPSSLSPMEKDKP